MRATSLLLSVGLSVCGANVARASELVAYDDRFSFTTAIDVVGSVDFNGIAPAGGSKFVAFSAETFSLGGVVFSDSASEHTRIVDQAANPALFSTGSGGGVLTTFSFFLTVHFPPGINAVGFNTNLLGSATLTVARSSVPGDTLSYPMTGASSRFIGIVSDGPIPSLTLRTTGPPGINIDDLVFGTVAPRVDLSVEAVDIAQVVWNPDIDNDGDIDLVHGKRAAIKVDIGVTGAVDASTAVVVSANLVPLGQLDGVEVARTMLTVAELDDTGQSVLLYFTPDAASAAELVVTVDPDGSVDEGSESNNHHALQVETRRTRDLNVAYIEVVGGAHVFGLPSYGRPSPIALGETSSMSDQFIKGTFPVASVNGAHVGFIHGHSVPFYGMLKDVYDIWIMPGADKGVGIVPTGYFSYHGWSSQGIRLAGIDACLSEVGYWTVPAHEIGHMLGLPGPNYDPPPKSFMSEEYEVGPSGTTTYAGNEANGFWVERGHLVPRPDLPIFESVLCLMGVTPDPRTVDTRWIDEEHYAQLFTEFLRPNVDPEVIQVGALLHSDGTLELLRWDFRSQGVPTESVPGGECSVRVLDAASGEALAEVNVPVDFHMAVEPLGIQPVDTMLLAVRLPYGPAASGVQILRNGTVLANVEATTKMLRDAIDAIPDHGFDRAPKARRSALQKKVAAIEKAISKASSREKLQRRVEDLRRRVERWLVDGYAKVTPLDLSKEEVLAAIEGMKVRIVNQGTVRSEKDDDDPEDEDDRDDDDRDDDHGEGRDGRNGHRGRDDDEHEGDDD